MDKLMSELDGLTDIDEIDMSDFGFDDILIEESQLSDPEDDDYDVTPVDDPISQLGQIWQLGNHRLMVCDSTLVHQVSTEIHNSEQISQIFTQFVEQQKRERLRTILIIK